MLRKLWVVLVALLWVTRFSASVMAQEVACDEETIRANTQRVIDEGFNQGNGAVIDELFAQEYVAHPDETDREAFRGQMLALRTAMPNGSAHIEHLLVGGCDAFFVFHQSGLMEGELAGPEGEEAVPPTGRDLHLDLHLYLRFNEAGQVVEEWDYIDNLSFLTQLGIIPAPEGAEPMAEATEEAVMAETVVTGGNETRNTDAVMRAFNEGFNAQNWELLRGLYAPDYAAADAVEGTPAGIEDLVNSMMAFHGAMPDATATVHDTVAQGDFVAARVTLSGTFQNELVFMGEEGSIPATGQPLTLEFSFLHQLTPEGLIVADWTVTDQLSFLEQTGLMEAGPEASGEAGTEATDEAGVGATEEATPGG
jgi:predicted ester cyclase